MHTSTQTRININCSLHCMYVCIQHSVFHALYFLTFSLIIILFGGWIGYYSKGYSFKFYHNFQSRNTFLMVLILIGPNFKIAIFKFWEKVLSKGVDSKKKLFVKAKKMSACKRSTFLGHPNSGSSVQNAQTLLQNSLLF